MIAGRSPAGWPSSVRRTSPCLEPRALGDRTRVDLRDLGANHGLRRRASQARISIRRSAPHVSSTGWPARSIESLSSRPAFGSTARLNASHVSIDLAVNRHDPIARPNARLLRRAARLARCRSWPVPTSTAATSAPRESTSVSTIDGEQQIHDRAGQVDLKADPFALGQELVGRAGAIVLHGLAGQLDVAAERHGADAVLRVATPELQHLGTEAKRKRDHPDAVPPRHQKVAELVDENQDAQDEQERGRRRQVGPDRAQSNSIS